jgi:hypothetical protein
MKCMQRGPVNGEHGDVGDPRAAVEQVRIHAVESARRAIRVKTSPFFRLGTGGSSSDGTSFRHVREGAPQA